MKKCFFCQQNYWFGHVAYCKMCNKPHRICKNCYKKGKKNGKITDSPRKITDIREENANKWT